MSELGKRILLAILASIALVLAQIILSALFPLYGATPGTLIGSIVFLTVLCTKQGFKWMRTAGYEWRLFGIQFLVLLLSQAMSSYHQNWVCQSTVVNFWECLHQSNTLAKFGDGFGTLILVVMTIWLLVRRSNSNDKTI